MSKVILHSHAKLNLYLAILKKRSDNYHNIETLFEKISLCDDIILKGRQDKKIMLSSSLSWLPRGVANLAYRSAKLLQDRFKVQRGVDIKIIKRIPVAAGLGGGSSNAASVLMGLNSLWGLHLSKRRLLKLAKGIGSDVPFFIYNRPFARGRGKGDIIKPVRGMSKRKLWHILVVPRIRVSTPFIYRSWEKGVGSFKLTMPKYGVKMLTLAIRKRSLPLIGEALFNSLEQVTTVLYPEVNRIKGRLLSAGVKAILMSGSGPAVFGVVPSRKEAASLSRQLRREDKSWQVFVARTV
ncbi:4-(cytidine 5'-diphospho)-2-C-methyl-D-erythritol kinase [Candidatus Omnitrophota bacterium]